MMPIDWEKHHRFQEKENYCGVAVIQMILCVAGIEKTQEEIAKDVFIPWWGVSQQILLAYLSRFFSITNFRNNCNTATILSHLRKNNILVINWWDDLDGEFEDGHYSIVSDYDTKTKLLTIVDPSGERNGIWKIKYSDFKHKWFDTLINGMGCSLGTEMFKTLDEARYAMATLAALAEPGDQVHLTSVGD